MQRRTLLVGFGAFIARSAKALYDPKPISLLEAAAGSWAGALTYRDYQNPDQMVTLATKMTCSLVAPDELALYYVFDDGPGKTVYSYERMRFDLVTSQLIWTSGTSKPSRAEYKIISSTSRDGSSTIAFEKNQDARTDKYSLALSRNNWLLTKYEAAAGAEQLLRSKYEFAKRDA